MVLPISIILIPMIVRNLLVLTILYLCPEIRNSSFICLMWYFWHNNLSIFSLMEYSFINHEVIEFFNLFLWRNCRFLFHYNTLLDGNTFAILIEMSGDPFLIWCHVLTAISLVQKSSIISPFGEDVVAFSMI